MNFFNKNIQILKVLIMININQVEVRSILGKISTWCILKKVYGMSFQSYFHLHVISRHQDCHEFPLLMYDKMTSFMYFVILVIFNNGIIYSKLYNWRWIGDFENYIMKILAMISLKNERHHVPFLTKLPLPMNSKGAITLTSLSR